MVQLQNMGKNLTLDEFHPYAAYEQTSLDIVRGPLLMVQCD